MEGGAVHADLALAEVDLELAGSRNGGAAHAACDERRVACLAALAREDSTGGVEAGDVIGLGEGANEDHLASLPRRGDGVARTEHDLALCGSR